MTSQFKIIPPPPGPTCRGNKDLKKVELGQEVDALKRWLEPLYKLWCLKTFDDMT